MLDSSLRETESLRLVENVLNSGDLDKSWRVLGFSWRASWLCGLKGSRLQVEGAKAKIVFYFSCPLPAVLPLPHSFVSQYFRVVLHTSSSILVAR